MASHPKSKTITATEASNHFGSLINEAAQGKSLFVVTRMGDPQAVVIGIEQYRDLLDALDAIEEANDPVMRAAIDEAYEDIRLGRTLTVEELDEALGFTFDEIEGNS
jgi:prevent-host-death family protein